MSDVKKGKPLLTNEGKSTPANSTGLCLDAKGNIWFDYKTGVGKFNRQTQQVSLYGSNEWVDVITYNGLQANKFRDGRFLVSIKKSKTNSLFFIPIVCPTRFRHLHHALPGCCCTIATCLKLGGRRAWN